MLYYPRFSESVICYRVIIFYILCVLLLNIRRTKVYSNLLLHGSGRKRKLHSLCEGTQELLLLLPTNLSNAGTFLPWIVRGEEESEEFHL
jgi:hypothetical protein